MAKNTNSIERIIMLGDKILGKHPLKKCGQCDRQIDRVKTLTGYNALPGKHFIWQETGEYGEKS